MIDQVNFGEQESKWKKTEHEYHIQTNMDMNHSGVKMSYDERFFSHCICLVHPPNLIEYRDYANIIIL